jgi:hypothetical protein
MRTTAGITAIVFTLLTACSDGATDPPALAGAANASLGAGGQCGILATSEGIATEIALILLDEKFNGKANGYFWRFRGPTCKRGEAASVLFFANE